MAERLYYAKAGPIDPVALVMENVAVFLKGNWHCYVVRFLEPLMKCNALVFDQGPVVAGGTSGDTILTNLDQQRDPPGIAQLRWFPLDDIRVTFKIGQAEARYTTTRITAQADRFTILTDPCLHTTEVLVLTTNTPYVDCMNPTDYLLPMSRIAFFGFRFLLADLGIIKATPAEVRDAITKALTTPSAQRDPNKTYPVTSSIVFVPSGSD